MTRYTALYVCKSWKFLFLISVSISYFYSKDCLHAQEWLRPPGDIFVDAMNQPIAAQPNFNWFTRGSKRELGAHQAMWEPLFVLDDSTGVLQPWLGLELIPDDAQKIWTLTLRKGGAWSDTKPFNADDVVFTANLVMTHDELPAAEAATFRSQVESVQKIDELTVQFTLRNPNPRFALENFGGALFSSFLIVPKHIWEGQDPMTFKFFKMDKGKIVWPVGTGPYVLKEIDNEQVIWERNDKWWGADAGLPEQFKPLPEPQTLIWRFFPDANAGVEAIKGDEIDVGPELTLDELNALQAANPKIIDWDPATNKAWSDPCARQLDINTDPTHAPWDNPKLRQAISLIIDRQEIVDSVYNGSTVPSRTLFYQHGVELKGNKDDALPPSKNMGAMLPFIYGVLNAKLGVSDHADLAAATTLIEGEGYAKSADHMYYKDAKALSLAISVNQDIDLDAKAVDVIVRQLKDAGIAAKALSWTTPEFWGRIVPQGNYEAAYSWLSCGSVAEPWTSMSRYTVDKVAPIGSRSPGFDNTGRWNSAAAKDYSKIVEEIGALPLTVKVVSGGTTTYEPNPAIPSKVVDAYKYLHDEMPLIPIVQSVKYIPFNTAYWTGWPTAADNYTAPMLSWSRARLIVHSLKKATP